MEYNVFRSILVNKFRGCFLRCYESKSVAFGASPEIVMLPEKYDRIKTELKNTIELHNFEVTQFNEDNIRLIRGLFYDHVVTIEIRRSK